jgi:beta-lactamase class A
MTSVEAWDVAGVSASWCAATLDGSLVVGHHADELVTPASLMKVQVALAAASLIDSGQVDGTARCRLPAQPRTPGPAGMSLMADEIEMSVRDLLVPMLTISDNVATDALLGIVGLGAANAVTARLGLERTRITSALAPMLDAMAREAGFSDYAALAAHDPAADGPPSDAEIRDRLARSSALDPARGSRTTPREMVGLLRAIWTGAAGPAAACARVRSLLARQLTRHRIASGFGAGFTVAAKSGGLMGIVRNEAGVVTDPAGASYALAIFTRCHPDRAAEPAAINAAIGRLARRIIDQLPAARP